MAMLKDMNVTVGRELIPDDAEYGSLYMAEKDLDPQYLVADNATGQVYVAYRSEITDYNWPSDPRRVPPPPKYPAYRNPHHPADHIPVDPLEPWKNPERQELGWPDVETVEETLARHRNNPTQRWNQPPVPEQVEQIVTAKRREERVRALDAGLNPDDPVQLAGAGNYTAVDQPVTEDSSPRLRRRSLKASSQAAKKAGKARSKTKTARAKAKATTAAEETKNA